MIRRRRPRPLVAVLAAALLASHIGLADPDPKAASQHFDRGVTLYGEQDWRGALVEFKRAYDAAPNSAVLYDIGQAYFQLRLYADALTAFEKYLAEAPANAPHRAEVEQTKATLANRVGKLDVSTNPPGAEILVDDDSIGHPAAPVLIAVGRHRVTAQREGQPPVTRVIEIAAGETATVRLDLDAGARPVPATSAPVASSAPAPIGAAPPPPEGGHSAWMPVAWVATGALAVGATVTGVIALHRGSQLDDARNDAPSTRAHLDSLHSSMKGYALATDILGGAAIVAGGISLYLTLAKPSATTGAVTITPTTRGAVLGGSF